MWCPSCNVPLTEKAHKVWECRGCGVRVELHERGCGCADCQAATQVEQTEVAK